MTAGGQATPAKGAHREGDHAEWVPAPPTPDDHAPARPPAVTVNDGGTAARPARGKATFAQTCIVCGAEFLAPSRRYQLCSHECSRERGRRLSRAAYHRKKGLTTVVADPKRLCPRGLAHETWNAPERLPVTFAVVVRTPSAFCGGPIDRLAHDELDAVDAAVSAAHRAALVYGVARVERWFGNCAAEHVCEITREQAMAALSGVIAPAEPVGQIVGVDVTRWPPAPTSLTPSRRRTA